MQNVLTRETRYITNEHRLLRDPPLLFLEAVETVSLAFLFAREEAPAALSSVLSLPVVDCDSPA